MGFDKPTSLLTSHELGRLASFDRTLADDLDAALANGGSVPSTRTLTAGTGLTGGGDLSINRSFALANTAVSPGTYTNTTLTVDAQGRITAASNGSVTSTMVSVKTYGAVGDGVVDDTTPIRNALAAAIAANLPLWFPNGTYKITAMITVPTNTAGMTFVGTNATVRFPSTAGGAQHAFEVATGCRDFTVQGLTLQGDNVDDFSLNSGAGFMIDDNVTDVIVKECTFVQCTPVMCNDSLTSQRFVFSHNYVHNCPNGLHPMSRSLIDGNYFICDVVVGTRAQAIYTFGQQVDIAITNNRFVNISTEAIQIRAGNSRFNVRDNFRIIGNHFENCQTYAVWVGSDDHPDIGEVVIANNTFKNCGGCIQAQGPRSATITGNHMEWDWEFPFSIPNAGDGIFVAGLQALPGHYQSTLGVVVANNKMIIRHPFVGKITLTSQPLDGDQITIGAFTYTFRTTPSVEGDVGINVSGGLRSTTDNFHSVLQGNDAFMTAPNNVVRFTTDVMNNQYGATYGTTDFNLIVLASETTYSMSTTSPRISLVQPVDMRGSVGHPIEVVSCIGPVIQGNMMDDCSGIVVTQCYRPIVQNNVVSVNDSVAGVLGTSGNILPYYAGNHLIVRNRAQQGRLFYSQIDDAFPIVEDNYVVPQQYTVPDLLGRSGTVSVGDGHAYAYFYYGHEISLVNATTRPYRWDDGDQVGLLNGVTWTFFTFKRTSPGAGQFNDPVSLMALINATPTWTAAYVTYQNDTANPATIPMIKIKFAATGAQTVSNTGLVVTRYKKPSDNTTWTTVPQPLMVGCILRNTSAGVDDTYARFYGGSATPGPTKTFVHTPLANPDRGVTVQGVDSTSQALSPIVYRADIIPGVGFTITHGAAAGTEKFFFRVH